MAASDARPIPIKNTAYRVTFPIFDADGDLVTGAGSLDSEVSKDGGTFADCTNEATEIATSSGMYYLDLTSTEMNADTVAVIVKSASAKTTPIVLYPQESADIKVDVTYWNGTAVATPHTAGYPVVTIKDGTGTGEIDTNAGAVVAVTTVTNLTNDPSGVTTLLSRLSATRAGYLDNLSAGAVATAAKLLSYFQSALRSDVTVDADIGGTYDDATDSQQAIRDRGDAAWTTADVSGLATAAALATVDGIVDDILVDTSTTLQAELDGIQADTEDIQSRLPVALVGGRIDASVGAMASNVLTAAALAADAVAEIWAGITAAAGNWIADHVLRRRTANVEASAEGDTIVGADSLYGMIQQHRAADTTTNPGSLTIFESDGTTELEQLTLATDAAADPVTGVG